MINPQLLKSFIEFGDVPFHEGASSFMFTCPRCFKDRKLYIRKRDGRFICFKCKEDSGFQGKQTEYALVELYDIPMREIIEKIYGNVEIALMSFLALKLKNPYDDDDELLEENELEQVEMPSDFIDVTNPRAVAGFKYLQGRGMDKERMDKYRIAYNPNWKTVVFPAYMNGTLVGWQERGTNSDFKYSLKGFKKEKALLFYDQPSVGHMILCEGPMDAIKADLCGGAVASMGKGVSKRQLEIIKNKTKVLYLALDPDASV